MTYVRESPQRDDQVARRLIAGALGIRTRPKAKKPEQKVEEVKTPVIEERVHVVESEGEKEARLREEEARRQRSHAMWEKQQADRQKARERKMQVKAATPTREERWETCVDSEGEEV